MTAAIPPACASMEAIRLAMIALSPSEYDEWISASIAPDVTDQFSPSLPASEGEE
jgi:hypothetical protein